jgi:hypothetical protein
MLWSLMGCFGSQVVVDTHDAQMQPLQFTARVFMVSASTRVVDFRRARVGVFFSSSGLRPPGAYLCELTTG